MGNRQTKKPPKVDPTEALFEMKLNAKKFQREANKMKTDKTKAISKAKSCLKVGDEDGAKLFIQQSTQKGLDYKKYLSMSHQFDYIYGQIKSQNLVQEMSNNLIKMSKYLKDNTDNIKYEEVHNNLSEFNKQFDNLNVQGKILNEELNNKNITNPNSNEDILNQLKNEVNYELTQKNSIKNQSKISENENKNNIKYEDLTKI